jgi:hypothetical protein
MTSKSKSESQAPPFRAVDIADDPAANQLVVQNARNFLSEVLGPSAPQFSQLENITNLSGDVGTQLSALLSGNISGGNVPIFNQALSENLRQQSNSAEAIDRLFGSENFGRLRSQAQNITDFGRSRAAIAPQIIQQGVSQLSPLATNLGQLLLQRTGQELGAAGGALSAALQFSPLQSSRFEQESELRARSVPNQSTTQTGASPVPGILGTVGGLGLGAALAPSTGGASLAAPQLLPVPGVTGSSGGK